jgi:hypothetical protein
MKKKLSYGTMLDRAGKYFNYFIFLLMLGGALIMLGSGVRVEPGVSWIIHLMLRLALPIGIVCVVLSFICFVISFRWDRKAKI